MDGDAALRSARCRRRKTGLGAQVEAEGMCKEDTAADECNKGSDRSGNGEKPAGESDPGRHMDCPDQVTK